METEPFNRLASNILDQAIARAEFWRQEARRLAGGDQAAFERALAMARKHANVKRYFEGLL